MDRKVGGYMNIGVCIKAVYDYEIPADKFHLVNNRMFGEYKEVIGLYDEHAIEVALQLKSNIDAKLYAISYGKAQQIPILKKALSMGADELILIEASSDEPFKTAHNLTRIIKQYSIDLVILGRVSSDLEREAVPPLVAGMLGWVYLPYIVAISKDSLDNTFLCTQQLDDKNLILRISDNFVVSITDAPCNLPRIPNLKEIMKSKNKPIKIEPDDIIEQSICSPEIQVRIPTYEYVNEMLPNENLSYTAKILLENLKKEHYL